MAHRAGKKANGHRSKPRHYSSARVYGYLGGWTKEWRRRAPERAPSAKKWEQEW